MSSCSPIFPQNYSHLPKAKKTHKVVDIHSFVGIITQQLSNSATQQLSNSATQQLSNSATQQLSNSATQQLSNSATQGVKTVCALTLGQLFFTNSGIFSYTLLQAAFYFLIIDTAGVTCSGIFCTAALQRQCSDNPIINKTLDRNVNSARLPAFFIGKMCTVFRQGW